jgi:hypothetical protein
MHTVIPSEELNTCFDLKHIPVVIEKYIYIDIYILIIQIVALDKICLLHKGPVIFSGYCGFQFPPQINLKVWQSS